MACQQERGAHETSCHSDTMTPIVNEIRFRTGRYHVQHYLRVCVSIACAASELNPCIPGFSSDAAQASVSKESIGFSSPPAAKAGGACKK